MPTVHRFFAGTSTLPCSTEATLSGSPGEARDMDKEEAADLRAPPAAGMRGKSADEGQQGAGKRIPKTAPAYLPQ
jgi:hypothetical protein